MKKILSLKKSVIIIVIFFALPAIVFAADPAMKEKTFTGTVTDIVGSQIYFKSSSAAIYRAELGGAQLVRKNGAAMLFGEILKGDRVEVRGMLWGDASISASYVRNMSLYTHSGTFSGKISSINPQDSSLMIESRQNGTQAIHTDAFTVFKLNSSIVTFKDLALGYSVSVNGVWDRSNLQIRAKSVTATVRLVAITVTGAVTAKTATGLTVVANGNILYGVDISGSKLQNKNGKTISISQINLGDTVKVEGKHISENTKIFASMVKDISITK